MCLKIFEVPTVIMQRYDTDVRMKQSLKEYNALLCL